MKQLLYLPSPVAIPVKPRYPAVEAAPKNVEAEELEFKQTTSYKFINVKRPWLILLCACFVMTKVLGLTFLWMYAEYKVEKRVVEELRRLKQIEYAKGK